MGLQEDLDRLRSRQADLERQRARREADLDAARAHRDEALQVLRERFGLTDLEAARAEVLELRERIERDIKAAEAALEEVEAHE